MSKHLAIRRRWRRARCGSEAAAGLKLDPGGLGLVVRTCAVAQLDRRRSIKMPNKQGAW
jgi:hypothetical protein